MEKYKKKRILILTLIYLPIFAYIIAQFAMGYFSDMSIGVLLVIAFIYYINISMKETKSTEKNTPAVKIASLVMVILMLGASFLMYYFIVKDIFNSGATLVDATVINVEDKTIENTTYQNGRTKIEQTQLCEVTFRYTLDGNTFELVHDFPNIRYFAEEQIGIYIKDGQFVATENKPIWGTVFIIYYIILALINLLRIFRGINVMVSIVCTAFAASAGLLIMALQVSTAQFFFNDFTSAVLLLSISGLFILCTSIEKKRDITPALETE